MKVLVAIAHHGSKNRAHLTKLLDSYKSMDAEVDIVILAEEEKDIGRGVEIRVGLPSSDPWSLPFAHRALFAERQGAYDLYIYSEDDTLLSQEHLSAFMLATRILPPDKIAGFMRYEQAPDGSRSYCTIHSHYHWETDSAFCVGEDIFARFSNLHSACYMLSSDHLDRCIDSGGFLVEPHSGVYDMLVSAATDPYTQCGLEKVISLSRVDDFLIHHLPNVYLGKMGISEGELRGQVKALMGTLDGQTSTSTLYPVQPRFPVPEGAWNKCYYQEPVGALLSLVDGCPGPILSVGTGSGHAEVPWIEAGIEVVGIPLDDVIAVSARGRGIEVTPSGLDNALRYLQGRRFPVIVLCDALAHCASPVDLLRTLQANMMPGGRLITYDPNERGRRLRALAKGAPYPMPRKVCYDKSWYRATGPRQVREWLLEAGWRVDGLEPILQGKAERLARMTGGTLNRWLAEWIVTCACPDPAG